MSSTRFVHFRYFFFIFELKKELECRQEMKKTNKRKTIKKKNTEQPTNIPHVYIIFVVFFFHLPIIHTILYYMQHWTRRGNSCFINYLVHILAWYCKLYTIEISEGIWGIISFNFFLVVCLLCLYLKTIYMSIYGI